MSRKSNTKHTAQSEEGQAEEGEPLAHPVLAEVLVVVFASLLRNVVVHVLEKGKFVQTEKDRKLLKTSPARRMGLRGAKYVAKKSVPGALLVGTGIVANTLIRGRADK